MLKNRSIPFGYCMINGKYALNAVEAKAVRKIFKEYINGKSLKTVAAEMQIPYNSGKGVWNLNMVCRVIENAKYIGVNGFPQIISDDDFNRAAKIKAERNTYRKPNLQDNSKQAFKTEIPITEYSPTAEIQNMNNGINRLLDSKNSDKSDIEKRITECAQLKYSAIKEVTM